jgi:CHRD domain
MLSWSITYSGLSGKATAAHFHGPAKEGENAGPMVPLTQLDMPALSLRRVWIEGAPTPLFLL